MDIVKKNLFSIVFGVVAILAIVALFFPIHGYYHELQTKADARKETYNALKGISQKDRNLPVIDPDNTEPKKLEQFPTQNVITATKAVTDKFVADAGALTDAAIKLNTHTELVPGSLPGGATSTAIRFRTEYNKAFDVLATGDARQAFFPVKLMNAGSPPSDAQIQQAREKVATDITAGTVYDAQNQPINHLQIQAALDAALPAVADKLKREAATNCKVYIEPTALKQYQPLASAPPGQPPEPSVIFIAQVGLWIQEDVCKSIAAANKESTSVEQSAVKHLLKIDLPDELFHVQAANSDPAVVPAAPTMDWSQKLTDNFAASPTGRSTNGIYDVFPFVLRINVDASQIPRVLQEIQRSKFVTVTNLSFTNVDSGLAKLNGYFYGDAPVVTLDLRCETLFLRKWTEPLMPLRVKQAIGLAPPAAGATPSGGGLMNGF